MRTLPWQFLAVLAACLFCLPLAAQQQTSENNDRLKQYLQRFPGADADKNGVLTLQEAQNHRVNNEGRLRVSGRRGPTRMSPTSPTVRTRSSASTSGRRNPTSRRR